MNIRCPKCRYEHDLKVAMREQDLVEIIKMQVDFAPHSKLVFEYAELFDTTRPIKAAKLLRILTELHRIWTTGNFKYRQTPYQISRDGIVNALTVVCNKKLDTLDSHNYLVKVMIGIAEQEGVKRAAQEEQALRKKEEGLKCGVREGGTMRERGGMPSQVKDFIKGL